MFIIIRLKNTYEVALTQGPWFHVTNSPLVLTDSDGHCRAVQHGAGRPLDHGAPRGHVPSRQRGSLQYMQETDDDYQIIIIFFKSNNWIYK